MTPGQTLKLILPYNGAATGSRYWNELNPTLVPITDKTDYDYVAEYSKELVELLKKHGFFTINPNWSNTSLGKQYPDAYTKVVLYYKAPNQPEIQVILKTNVEKYIRLQKMLTPEFFVAFLWKRNQPVSFIQSLLQALTQSI